MITYHLTASLGNTKHGQFFGAVDDTAAMFKAMNIILDRAHSNPKGAYALGEIVLINRSTDEVVNKMEAK